MIVHVNKTAVNFIRNMSSVSKKKIDLYYDVISPYSWFAFEVLLRYQSKWNVNLELKPVLLGGIMNSTGNSPPMMIPNKAKYMIEDVPRCASYFGVPIKLDVEKFSSFVQYGSLAPNRLLTATKLFYPQYLANMSRALWMELWNKGNNFTDPDTMKNAAITAGLDEDAVSKLINALSSQEVKDNLKKVAEEAVNLNAFGVPTIVTNVSGKESIFFGSDRFPLVAASLGEVWEGPLPDISKL